jgi:NADP-dependent 3-hydroxy acid dehydrogenase YdfG
MYIADLSEYINEYPIMYLSSHAEEDIAMAKVWLITGSGNGLGRDIAEPALAAGDNVVAGARRTEELAPLVAQYGERVKPGWAHLSP